MYKFIPALFIVALFGLVLSCDDFERNVDIELPEIEKELVVECYLEAGQPYRVTLTETKNYFENLQACPFVQGATVVIEHNGVRDTLNEAFYIGNCNDSTLSIPISYPTFLNTRFANYGSNTKCPKDYNSDFKLEIHDHVNDRMVTATTRLLPPVALSSIKTEFNNQDEAYALVSAQDDANEVNFYRLMLHEGSLTESNNNPTGAPTANRPEFDAVIDDARFFNGKMVALGTSYRYSEGDTLIATIYHIDKAYHDYLETARDAQSNNGNPFGQPGTILTNVEGGQGIFTFLSYDRDTVYVSR